MAGRIRIKSLVKALAVYFGALERNRVLTVDEIVQAISGSRSNAYNYQRFLRCIFPEGAIDEDRRVGDKQRCLM
jgi:hypothetical protein